MPITRTAGLGIVGCGNIAAGYGKCIAAYPDQLRIVGGFDTDSTKCEEFGKSFDCRSYDSYEALLDDPEIEIVVNLTVHTAHAAVTRQALLAGKHVHSEKPLATDRASGTEVVELAAEKGLILSCSPFVILGEAQQTLWKAVRDGVVGEVISANAEMFWGRIEAWHPAPQAFYQEGAGPMLDVGVYPLNVLTSILGPVKEVRGLGEITLPEREILSGPSEGEKYEVTTPDIVFGLLRFESGPICRLSATFSPWMSKETGLEIHGSKGSLAMNSCVGFNTPIELSEYPVREWKEWPAVREPFPGVDWARGPLDTAEAIQEGRPSRVSGEHANHILDVCLSILDAAKSGQTVQVQSSFTPPEPI